MRRRRVAKILDGFVHAASRLGVKICDALPSEANKNLQQGVGPAAGRRALAGSKWVRAARPCELFSEPFAAAVVVEAGAADRGGRLAVVQRQLLVAEGLGGAHPARGPFAAPVLEEAGA